MEINWEHIKVVPLITFRSEVSYHGGGKSSLAGQALKSEMKPCFYYFQISFT